MIVMVAYNPPSSKAVVNIPEPLADRYEAAGWTKAETEKKPTRRRKAEDDEK